MCYSLGHVDPKEPARSCAGKEGRRGFDEGPNREGTRRIRTAGRQSWRTGAGEDSYESQARRDSAEGGGGAVGEEGLTTGRTDPPTSIPFKVG